MKIDDMLVEYSWDGNHHWNIAKSPFGSYELYCQGQYQNSFSNIDEAISYMNDVEAEKQEFINEPN